MASLADLQPDRRAVLKLLIGRGRGYDQIAELLQLPELIVRRRAHDAITELAGGKGDITDEQRALLCDYLVGELPASRRAEARKLLADDAGARRFARGAAARLSGIEGAQLPELPAEDEEVAEALDALDARRERKVELESSSKRGAWFLIGGVVVLILVVVGLALHFSGGSNNSDDTVSNNSSPAATPASTTGNTLVAELATPSGSGSAKGQAALKPNSTGATILALHATGVSPTKRLTGGRFTAFAFWLEGPNGVKPLRLGFYDPKSSTDGSAADDGTIDLGVTLDGASGAPAVTPATLAKYSVIVITRETLTSTTDTPSTPGPIVLQGTLAHLG